MEQFLFLPAPIVIPLLMLAGTWHYTRTQDPGFRMQLSILDLWVMALCFSLTALVAVLISRKNSIETTVFLTVALILHQLAGAYFMYVLEQLTPKAVRGSPMPLVLLAGNLVGATLFPAITLLVMGCIALAIVVIRGV